MSRVVLVGVDGATYDLLDPWMDDGRLPNFAAVAEAGVADTLESVVPTQSIPAWPSFNTGKNPGKHGLFAFNENVAADGDVLLDSTHLEDHRFWDLLAADGVTPGVLGSMLTYPPRRLERGFEVSGPLTPAAADDFADPPELVEELRAAVPDYAFGADLTGDRSNVQRACIGSADCRATAARHLMTTREWEFFSVVFVATDRAQHKLWDTPEMIRPVYERIDEFLDWLRGEFPDANVLLVSDHGFTDPPERDFFLNAWLTERSDDAGSEASMRYGIAKRVYSRMRRATGVDLRGLLPAALEEWIVDADDDDSLPPIRAAADTHFDGVFVNDDLDDYETIREELIAALRSVTDPETGDPVVRAAWKREERYGGAYAHRIPDVVVLPHPNYHVNANPYTDTFGLFPGMESEGAHDAAPDGILMGAGPDVASRRDRHAASLLDVPPTILHLCGTPVPEDFDGTVLTGSLGDGPAERPVEYQPPVAYDPPGGRSGAGDREDVEDRLDNLGYL